MAELSRGVLASARPGIGRLDLVVAVACLGALAAMAVPQYQEVSAATRRTEVTALANSVRSAAQLGHSLWQAQGGPQAIAVPRGAVTLEQGYPAAADLALLMEASESMAFTHAGGRWQHRDLGAERPCGLSYAPPPRAGAGPVVTLQVTGC